jgi:hypothetical protein
MNNTVLLQKLIAIERLIGRVDDQTLRNLLLDAQDYLLAVQKAQADAFLSRTWRDGVADLQGLRQAS